MRRTLTLLLEEQLTGRIGASNGDGSRFGGCLSTGVPAGGEVRGDVVGVGGLEAHQADHDESGDDDGEKTLEHGVLPDESVVAGGHSIATVAMGVATATTSRLLRRHDLFGC